MKYLFFRIDFVTHKRLFYLNFIDFSINVTNNLDSISKKHDFIQDTLLQDLDYPFGLDVYLPITVLLIYINSYMFAKLKM